MDFSDQQFSLSLSPEPFCTFCLRARPPNEQLYKYITGGFVEMRLSFQSLLGYDFQLDSFAICKPCWNLVQLYQDFRAQCHKATGLVERICQGLKGEDDDDWFSEANVGTIEGLQKSVQDQLTRIERVHAAAGVEIKTESFEIESNAIVCGEQLEQGKTNCFPTPAFHIEEIKAQNYDEESKSSATEPNYEALHEIKQEARDSSDDLSEDDKMNIESDDEDEPEGNPASGLVECEKCKRRFDKVMSLKLHSMSCNGIQPSRLYTCNQCQATFLTLRILKTHMNKHEGKTPFPCRKHCKASFMSNQIRNRHELKCGSDRRKCTLCEEVLADKMRLFAHYRLVHPGERRYPCQTCGKRFQRTDTLASHKRRLHTEGRVKTESCQFCGKMFAELHDVKSHIKVVHERANGSRPKPVQCEICGQKCSKQNALNMHMAAVHPNQTSMANREAYRRKCKRNLERKRSLKLAEKV